MILDNSSNLYRLVLASEDERIRYEQSSTGSGLPRELDYLRKDPLARQELGRTGWRGLDHLHLSTADSQPELVQWWGRGSSGYHYPVGRVMRIIQIEDPIQ